jgi:predicted ABC-type ATPase
VKCLRFLNADEIARGLSPLDPGAAVVKAARLLLSEFRSCVANRQTFAIESTLSGKTYNGLFRDASKRGFEIRVHYLWLPTVALAIARVRERVKKGGHGVSSNDIRRRFARSRMLFANEYAPLADRWAVWDNQTSPPTLLAESGTCRPDQLGFILRK